jgi:hypothetical protein
MKHFTIDHDNNITVYGSAKEAAAVPDSERFSNEAALAKLAANWPTARLVEIWNSLQGATEVKKFKDRATAVNNPKQLFVPSGVECELVICYHKCAPLRFRQMTQNDHRDLLHAELLRREKPGVARDQPVVGIHKDWVGPPELFHGRCYLVDLGITVSAGVSLVGLQPFDGPALNLDVDVRGGNLPLRTIIGMPDGLCKAL